jgi:hypothetical protein
VIPSSLPLLGARSHQLQRSTGAHSSRSHSHHHPQCYTSNRSSRCRTLGNTLQGRQSPWPPLLCSPLSNQTGGLSSGEQLALVGAALAFLTSWCLMLCAAPHHDTAIGVVTLWGRVRVTSGMRWVRGHRVLLWRRAGSACACLVVGHQISDVCEHCDIGNSCRKSLCQSGANDPCLKIFCRITRSIVRRHRCCLGLLCLLLSQQSGGLRLIPRYRFALWRLGSFL